MALAALVLSLAILRMNFGDINACGTGCYTRGIVTIQTAIGFNQRLCRCIRFFKVLKDTFGSVVWYFTHPILLWFADGGFSLRNIDL